MAKDRPKPWSDAENDLVVADYFAMLAKDLAGRPYSKLEHNRNLQRVIQRGEKSIEFKHQNISAVLQRLGEVWIPGYKPRMNFQNSLVFAIERWLDDHPEHLNRALFPASAIRLRESPLLSVSDPPPPNENSSMKSMEKVNAIVRKFDVADREQRNRALGRAGEQLVLAYELQRLVDAGKYQLANRVKWISDLEGDGAGYDIASFSLDGRPRLIEVKTTNGWSRTPFYLSRNELSVANERIDEWCLFRVWNFSREPKGFELRPPLDAHVELSPTSYLASFR